MWHGIGQGFLSIRFPLPKPSNPGQQANIDTTSNRFHKIQRFPTQKYGHLFSEIFAFFSGRLNSPGAQFRSHTCSGLKKSIVSPRTGILLASGASARIPLK
jgi:hypothetical protein